MHHRNVCVLQFMAVCLRLLLFFSYICTCTRYIVSDRGGLGVGAGAIHSLGGHTVLAVVLALVLGLVLVVMVASTLGLIVMVQQWWLYSIRVPLSGLSIVGVLC